MIASQSWRSPVLDNTAFDFSQLLAVLARCKLRELIRVTERPQTGDSNNGRGAFRRVCSAALARINELRVCKSCGPRGTRARCLR
jgi:hypothetical protein